MPPNTITLGQVLEMSPGEWVNDEFEAVVQSITFKQTKTGKSYGSAVLADPFSPGITLAATVWSNALSRAQGKLCRFGGQGMKLDEYRGKLQLSIGDKATCNVLGDGPNHVPPVSGSGHTQHAPNAGKPASGQGTTIYGATVGMAINQARECLQAERGPELADYLLTNEGGNRLHQLASVFVRLALHMEAGNLRPSSATQQTAAAPAPQPQRQQPPPRQPRQHQPDDNPTGQAFPDDDMGDEDVPF